MVVGEPPLRPLISILTVEFAGTSSSPDVASPAPVRARSLKNALAVVDVLWTITAVNARDAVNAEPVFESVKLDAVRSVQSVDALPEVSVEPINAAVLTG
jgi:hypothetical protein